jgi:hypothetical protein
MSEPGPPSEPAPAEPGPPPEPPGAPGDATDPDDPAAPASEMLLARLREAAAGISVARRLQGDVELQLLQSVVDAAAALYEAAEDRRFDLATARRTGYLPRSLAAVPLVDGTTRVGVLQVLDKRGACAFSERDMRLLEVFARQAAAAIGTARQGRDRDDLLRGAITAVGAGALSGSAIETLLTAAADKLDGDGTAFWDVVDRVAPASTRPRALPRLVAAHDAGYGRFLWRRGLDADRSRRFPSGRPGDAHAPGPLGRRLVASARP